MQAFSRPSAFQALPGPLTPEHQLILVSPDGRTVQLPEPSQLPGPAGWPQVGERAAAGQGPQPIVLGRIEEGRIEEGSSALAYAAAYSASPLQNGVSLRDLARIDEPAAALAGYAVQVLDFHSTHQYCGRCSAPTEVLSHEVARRCPACHLTVYPRVAPAIMTLIWRGHGQAREFLLARGPRHPESLYSVVAGFAEPSETLEACCHREVMEELGVRIYDPRYVLSQPWPMPHSLMVAFTAEYAGGDITPQPGEIEAARWFSVHDLPRIPEAYSCAYHLIQHGLASEL